MIWFLYTNISRFNINFDCVFDDGNYKSKINSMHIAGWKDKHLNSSGVSMIDHSYGFFNFLSFITKRLKYSNVTSSIFGIL